MAHQPAIPANRGWDDVLRSQSLLPDDLVLAYYPSAGVDPSPLDYLAPNPVVQHAPPNVFLYVDLAYGTEHLPARIQHETASEPVEDEWNGLRVWAQRADFPGTHGVGGRTVEPPCERTILLVRARNAWVEEMLPETSPRPSYVIVVDDGEAMGGNSRCENDFSLPAARPLLRCLPRRWLTNHAPAHLSDALPDAFEAGSTLDLFPDSAGKTLTFLRTLEGWHGIYDQWDGPFNGVALFDVTSSREEPPLP